MRQLDVYKMVFDLLNENNDCVWDENAEERMGSRFYGVGVIDLANKILAHMRKEVEQASKADPNDYAMKIDYNDLPKPQYDPKDVAFVTGLTTDAKGC